MLWITLVITYLKYFVDQFIKKVAILNEIQAEISELLGDNKKRF